MLPLNKTIEIPTMTIVVTAVFHENIKYYSQIFLDECINYSYLIKCKAKQKHLLPFYITNN